jgi:hypothetical protein
MCVIIKGYSEPIHVFVNEQDAIDWFEEDKFYRRYVEMNVI